MKPIEQLTRWYQWRKTISLFNSIQAEPSDHLIDCGANVGDFTELLVQKGGIVHAIEPNPNAYARLAQRFSTRNNVHCIPCAVHTKNGDGNLYLHKDDELDPVKFSTGSSMIAEKPNVNITNCIRVKTLDLDEYIRNIGHVRILKMDIEGLEVEVLETLIQNNTFSLIDHVFVVTHDHKISELRTRTQKLRKLALQEKYKHLHLHWR